MNNFKEFIIVLRLIIMFGIFLFLLGTAQAQNITNTLGNTGIFTIKDAANTYLTLTQSTGNVSLSRGLNLSISIGSNAGTIYKNNTRFIHDYYPVAAFGGNTFVGLSSGNFTMTGSSLASSFNTGIGNSSLTSLTSGYNNSAFGYNSMFDNSQGAFNSAFGSNVMSNNTTGSQNSAFGFEALLINQTSISLSAFGYQSLRNNTGALNSAYGSQSMFTNTSGSNNSAFGYQASYSNNTASNNSSFGYQSMFTNNGQGNSAFGYQSLYFNSAGVENAAFGFQSLYNCANSQNTGFGHSSLLNLTSGVQNTAIGNDAGVNVITGSNLTLIGYNAQPTTSSVNNQITLGNASVTSLRCAVTTITSLSDARDKKNIHELNLGLNFITKIKPRIFNWDKREWYDNNISDGSKLQEAPTAGFIAQELDEAQISADAEWLNLVLKDNPEKWEATPGNLLPVMVKAIQELNAKCDSLQEENKKLTVSLSEIDDLKNKLALISEQLQQLTDKKSDLQKLNITKENNSQVSSDENTK